MANRFYVENYSELSDKQRNKKIWNYWIRGYRQLAIAKMFKMKESAVSMVICRERDKGK